MTTLTNYDNPQLVAKLIDSITKTWDQHKVCDLFNVSIAQEIIMIPFGINSSMGRQIWTGNHLGEYTVMSGYNKNQPAHSSTNNNQPSSSYQPPNNYGTGFGSLNLTPRSKPLCGVCAIMPYQPRRTYSRENSYENCFSLYAATNPKLLFASCKWIATISSNLQINIATSPCTMS